MYNPSVEATARLTLAVVKELLDHKVAAKVILAVIDVMREPTSVEQPPALDLSRLYGNLTSVDFRE